MIKELEEKLHKQIPLTKYMQLHVKSLDEEKLITTAPLEPNINDKGTGFAGSLSTLVTISAWSVCYLEVSKLGYQDAMIAIIKSDTSYRAPVTKELNCMTTIPDKNSLELLAKKLANKGSASIRIKSKLIENNNTCVDFDGVYVVKVN